jgi:hypothetical protein
LNISTKGRAEIDGKPGEARDLHLRPADRRRDALRDINAALEIVAAEMEHLERRQLLGALDQLHHRFGQIRQVGPIMADIARARIADDLDRRPGCGDAGHEPVVAGMWSEEVAGANDQHRRAGCRRLAQPILHGDPDFSFAGRWLLRRTFIDQRKRVGPEIIDGAGEHDTRANRLRRGDRAFQHRQSQALPIAITRRVGAMEDDRRALGRRKDVAGVHRVALDPFNALPARLRRRHGRIAVQSSHPPAASDQHTRDRAANATRSPNHQCCSLLCHDPAPACFAAGKIARVGFALNC